MAAQTLRREEYAGLVVAIAAHAALVAVLVLRPPSPPLIPPVERVTVTLSDDATPTSTSPEPSAQAAPDTAPELGEAPAPAVMAQPDPRVMAVPPPGPEPKAQPRPVPASRAAPQRSASKVAEPVPRPAAVRPVLTRPAITRPAATRPGGNRIGDDFLRGVPNTRAAGTAPNPPAAVAGPAVTSALSGVISRQLKPNWSAPQGVDAEKLVTILSWNLNADGTLAGSPRVVRQDGITDANRPQAARHAEQAIRAVQLAAPFNLPAEYYDAWKRVAQFRFDKRLSQ